MGQSRPLAGGGGENATASREAQRKTARLQFLIRIAGDHRPDTPEPEEPPFQLRSTDRRQRRSSAGQRYFRKVEVSRCVFVGSFEEHPYMSLTT
ncbi:MAG: hypothetical protein N2C14_28605, partial [Planctomycetales bacterium]